MLVENKEHYADHKKQCKLDEDNHAAAEQRHLAVAFIPRRQHSLHQCLIRPMACHGQKRPANHAGPKCVTLGQAERKIEDAQLPSGSRRHLGNLAPTAGNPMQQQPERHCRASQINCQLHHVRPNHSLKSALKGVKKCEHGHDQDGRPAPGPERDAHNFAHRRDSYPLRKCPGNQKDPCPRRLDAHPESLL